MTALPLSRKNNLLSLLRGYDLPIKHNYLNATLLGYGKDEDKDKKKEERYQKLRSTVDASLEQYFNTFRNQIDNDDFWHTPVFYQALCSFTRFYIAGRSEKSSQFFSNIEGFLSKIVQSARYEDLLGIMDNLADKLRYEQGDANSVWAEYERIKKESKNNILKYSFRLQFQETPDIRGITNLILDCIVYSTESPEDFSLNWERYKDTVTMSFDKDITKLFSEDLEDTAYDDYLEESDGVFDSEDERFVVPDDEIEDEDEDYGENPVKKRRKIVDSDDDDDEGEVNGSGFYNWWW